MKFLTNLKNRLRVNLIKNKRGQGATEYILLLVVLVGVVMIFKDKIRGQLDKKMTEFGESIDNVKSTGD